MSKGGGGTNTVETQSGPPQAVLDQYSNVIAQANQVASTPYTTGGFNANNLVAPFNATENSAYNTINNAQGLQSPYLGNAQNLINNSQTPIWNNVQQYSPTTMAQYANPYLNQAVGSTEAEINNQDQQQQQQVIGNAISSGAWGGDRSAIAQSELANQQDLARNATISGMENTGFNQQQNEFNSQQTSQIGANEANAWLASQGAFGEANLGNESLNTTLSGANAQLAAGQQQQAQTQSTMNIPYEQFLAQQAYPFQTTGWLSGISTGVGGSSGGTGTTTSPGPSTASQLGGLGLAGLGLSNSGAFSGLSGLFAGADTTGDASFLESAIASAFAANRGGVVPARAKGGFIPHYDDGGAIGGLSPSVAGSNPMVQSEYAKYQNLPTEKLQELAARMGGTPQGAIIRQALQQKQTMTANPQQPQGISPQSAMARGGFAHYDNGGGGGALDQDMSPDDAAQMVNLYGDDNSPSAPPAPAAPGLSPVGAGEAMPSRADFMKNYTDTVSNAAPYNKVDPSESLMKAGFAMMAGQSPHALENVGEGALAGVNDYQAQKKQAASESERRGTLQEQGEGLYDTMMQHKEQMAHENAQLGETSRHNTVDEKQNQEKIDQGKYTVSPFGQVINTKTGEMVSNPSTQTAPPVDAEGKPITGDAYLATLPQDRAIIAKKIGDGEMPWPTGFALKTPVMIQGIMDASKYDSSANAERYGAVNKFTNGPWGQNNITFDTVGNHMAVISEAAKALDNGDVRAWNNVKNKLKEQYGDAAPTNMDAGKTFVSGEIVKAITGAGGVTDRQEAQKMFQDAASSGQLTGAANMVKDMVQGRVEATGTQWNSATKKDTYVDRWLSPQTKKWLNVDGGGHKMISVVSPDGKQTGYMSPSELSEAEKNGWKVAQ